MPSLARSTLTTLCVSLVGSKLRGCDLIRLRVADVHLGDGVRLRTTLVQQKTGRLVPFELIERPSCFSGDSRTTFATGS